MNDGRKRAEESRLYFSDGAYGRNPKKLHGVMQVEHERGRVGD
jgi:hypothetical protein